MSAAAVVTKRPQPLQALDRANELRRHRTALQRAVFSGYLSLELVLLSEDEVDQEAIRKLRVAQVLAWQRGIGDSSAERIVARAGMTPFTTVGALSRVRRTQLLAVML